MRQSLFVRSGIKVRARGHANVTIRAKTKSLTHFPRTEGSVPLEGAIVAIFNVVRIALGRPPTDHPSRRGRASSTFTRRARKSDGRDFALTERPPEHFHFIDQSWKISAGTGGFTADKNRGITRPNIGIRGTGERTHGDSVDVKSACPKHCRKSLRRESTHSAEYFRLES